ncbi:TPR repeat-containing protein [Mucilaginibacter pineti]|uniref:TPR repeat-containing protein n=1 Tax=Mucilaginibacter pineti TaxID=1391627 RepID=A0A1G7E363_9SPHI|nr:tetratricopeptide repeat protein [Mucilaginibacter pineti]SDE58091.1 TPR repeat-containing protein [Mucilaginibacter pineti]
MKNTFFLKAQFNANFGKEMASAASVYEQRKKSDIDDYALATYDFVFISDEQDKLTRLGNFLNANYGYKLNTIKKQNDYWELTGDATEFPVDENNLMYWALDLYCKGYEFDCKLDGYGAMGDPKNQKFPDMEINNDDHYFELAMEAYNKRNLGMAIIHFSTAIKINPEDPNSWYSRAIMKDELHTWKAARRDYDKAIELAPNFVDAIINRAANKDEAGEYEEAIQDYTMVIELDSQNEMAYFNRGNSKLNKKDNKGACEDWNKAKELGAKYAQKRIDEHCQQKTLQQKITGFFRK